MRLIDANALVEKKWDVPFETKDAHFVQVIDVGDVEEAPTIDPETLRPTGRWISLVECSNAGVYCSVCHKKVWKEDYAWCNRKNKIRSNYCPNCGAKMEG